MTKKIGAGPEKGRSTANMESLRAFLTNDEQDMLNTFLGWAYGGPTVRPGQQAAAMRDVQRLIETGLQRALKHRSHALDIEAKAHANRIEKTRFQLEFDRLEIERARVYVAALEVLVEAGIEGDTILNLVLDSTQDILTLDKPALKAIAERGKDE